MLDWTEVIEEKSNERVLTPAKAIAQTARR